MLLFAVAIVSCAALRTTGRPLGRAQLLSLRAPVLSLAEPEVEAAEPESPLPPAAPMDPRKAVEELGSLVKQVQEVWTDGKNWDMEERARRRREIVSSYVAVFAPAVAFSGRVKLRFIPVGWPLNQGEAGTWIDGISAHRSPSGCRAPPSLKI